MTEITVLSRTQVIIVDPVSHGISIVNAGLPGPAGPTGPTGPGGSGGDRTIGTGLATTGTVDLDVTALHNTIQTITLTGNIIFTTSNRAAGKEITIHLSAGGATRTITWPSWTAFGVVLPTSLASGKEFLVSVTFLGTTDASGKAAWTVTP